MAFADHRIMGTYTDTETDDDDEEELSTEFEDSDAEEHPASLVHCNKSGSNVQSIPFDDDFSNQYLDFIKTSGPLKRNYRWCRPWRWFLLVSIGLGTGLIAIAVDIGMEVMYERRMQVNAWVAEQGDVLSQYLAFIGVCVGFAAVAGVLVCYIEVLAAGSGIPEIKCYLNGISLPNLVGIKTLVAKAGGIVFSVAAGLPCGKEGPMIHSGAICGGLSARCQVRKRIKPLSMEREVRDLVASGAAAGVSAAFGAPMGGVLFAIEEGSSHMNPEIMLQLFVTCACAALVARLFAGYTKGGLPFGVLGKSCPVSFGRFEIEDYHVTELIVFLCMGILGGLLGALFNETNKKLSLFRQRCIPKTGHLRFIEVLVVTLLISSIQFWVPILHRGGSAASVDELDHTERLFWELGAKAMKDLLHREEDFDLPLLAVFAVLSWALSCLTYGLGVPSGLFVPSLLTGAAFGRIVGQTLPDDFIFALSGVSKAPPGIYAYIGATAMLSGAARITISLAMILIEVTGDANFSLPVFLVVMVAKWTGDAFNRSIYDIHIVDLKNVPLLEHTPEGEMLGMRVHHVMARDVKCLLTKTTVKNIWHVLRDCDHHGFPVLRTSNMHFVGLVARHKLIAILKELQEAGHLSSAPDRQEEYAPLVQYKEVSIDRLDDIDEDDPGLSRMIDLKPYVHTSCYTVPPFMVLWNCFKLFRQLGLRHLPVVSRKGLLKGIITRKDIILCHDSHEHGKTGPTDLDHEDQPYSDDEDEAHGAEGKLR